MRCATASGRTSSPVVGHARVEADVERLHVLLDEAWNGSALPDAAGAHDALHDLVIRVRPEG